MMLSTMLLPKVDPLSNLVVTAGYDSFHCPLSTFDMFTYQVCVLAEKSIRGILNSGDNVNFLLSLHQCDNKPSPNDKGCPTPVISTEW